VWHHQTPWIRCLLNNLTVAQIVSKFSAFYRTQNIHCLVQKALPVVLILSQMNSVYNIPFFSSRFTLILSSCQYLCLQSGLFHLCVTTKPYIHSSSLPCLPHVPSISSFLTYHPEHCWWGVQAMTTHMQFSPTTCHLLFCSNILLNTFSLRSHNLCSPFCVTDQVSCWQKQVKL
jgi:hypothetical protein